MLTWLKRLLGVGPKDQKPAAEKSYHFTEEHVRQQIERDVAGGFMTDSEVVQSAVDAFEDEGFDDLERLASGLAQTAIAEHAERQAAWPKITDCDRLDRAFAALEAKGVISRQNFTCCGTCGSYEIGDEIKAALEDGRPAHGYAFYQMQDTERAADGDGVYLNYGACEGTDEAAVAVGHEIVSELHAQGLTTDWDGRIERRIQVMPLDWKRRRPEVGV